MQHALENLAMLRKKEIFGFNLFYRGVKRVVVEKDCAQNAALRFQIVRQRFFECGIAGHLVGGFYSRVTSLILHLESVVRKSASCGWFRKNLENS